MNGNKIEFFSGKSRGCAGNDKPGEISLLLFEQNFCEVHSAVDLVRFLLKIRLSTMRILQSG